MDGLYAGWIVSQWSCHTRVRTRTHTHTRTQHGALCSTQAPGNRCSLQTAHCTGSAVKGVRRASSGLCRAGSSIRVVPPAFPGSPELCPLPALWREHWGRNCGGGGKGAKQLLSSGSLQSLKAQSHLPRVTQPHLSPRPKHLTWLHAASTGKLPQVPEGPGSMASLGQWYGAGNGGDPPSCPGCWAYKLSLWYEKVV